MTRSKKTQVYLFIVIFLALSIFPLHTTVSATSSNDGVVPGEVLVWLKPNVNPISFAAQNGLDNKQKASDRVEGQSLYRFRITDGSSPAQKASKLRQQNGSRIVYAEPNYKGQAAESVARSSWAKGESENGYYAQWASAKLRLPEAHARSRGAGITVAVIDTGIDLHHPLLASHIVPGYDFVDGDTVPQEEGTYGTDIAYGHGTHVAGLVHLVAPDAMIMPLRVLQPDGMGSNWAVIQALQYARLHNATVINLSYTAPRRSKVIDQLLETITCDNTAGQNCGSGALPGAVITAAAGNSGTPRREYPADARIEGILSVAASTQNDTIASFSTAGSWVQIAAPGEHISSSVPVASDSTYGTWSGTSMAAPLTAGVAALIRSAHPELSPKQIAELLVSKSAPINGPVTHRLDAAAPLLATP